MASSSSPEGDSWRAHYSPAPGMRTPFSSDYEAPEEPESEEVIRRYSPSSFTAGGKKSTDTGITVSSNLKTGSPLPTPGGLGGVPELTSTMLPANDSSEPEAPLAAKLLEEGTLGIVIGASNLRDVLDSHFAQPASTLSEALIRFVKPGGSMTLAGSEDIEEAVRLVQSLISDSAYVLMTDTIVPKFEQFAQQCIQDTLPLIKSDLIAYTSTTAAPVSNLLLDKFLKCIERLEKCEKHFTNAKIMSDSLSDQSIRLVEARTDLGLSDLSGTEELTTKIEAVDSQRTQIEKSSELLTSDIATVVMAHINRPAPSRTVRVIMKPLGLKDKFWDHEENARFGKEIATAVINYLSQDPANYSIVLTCLYYCFQQQYANDTITLPPSVNPSDKHALSFGTSKVLRLPSNLIDKYASQSKILYEHLYENFPLLVRKMRGKREYTCSDGTTVEITPKLGDGAMFLFHLYIRHANQSAVYKLQLRNKLEHMAGLFVRDPIQKTIDRLLPTVDDAIRFSINIDYELSIKATVNTLVQRSGIFMRLQEKYVLDRPSTSTVQTAYDLLMEVESVSRQSKVPAVQAANLDADARRQNSHANMVWQEDDDSDLPVEDDPDLTPKQTAMLAAVNSDCCAQGCSKSVSQSIVDSVNKKIKEGHAHAKSKNFGKSLLCSTCHSLYMAGTEIKLAAGGTKTFTKREGNPRRPRGSARANAATASETAAPKPTDAIKMHSKLMSMSQPPAEDSDESWVESLDLEEVDKLPPDEQFKIATRYQKWAAANNIDSAGERK